MALLVQAMLIVGLLYQRRARLRAEVDSRRNLSLAADANRRMTMSALTGSITHDLRQPLHAILLNAQAGEMMVASDRATPEGLLELLADIRTADIRATEIVERHRALLRNHQVDLATLDEVNSTDDSTYRVELLTPAQFHFATSMGGIDFRPEMLTATYDNVTGQLAYSVNGVRGAGRYVPEVAANGQPVMVTYSDGTTAQAMTYVAVRVPGLLTLNHADDPAIDRRFGVLIIG